MNFPNDVKYTKEHEWIRLEGDVAYVGITRLKSWNPMSMSQSANNRLSYIGS